MFRAKIGIRPVIDGRWGGVREALEEKTMAMAKAAKELIEANVFYADGAPFECVVSPCTIGGGAEAARCAEFFSAQNVCATLSVTPCWCYGSETMDMDPMTIKAVWGFNGTERPGAVYLAAVMARTRKKGCPRFPSMAGMYRIWTIILSLPMSKKKFCVLPAVPRRSGR
jgi:L-fucose/D-arabinose isomerase